MNNPATVRYNPYVPGFFENPYEQYAALRWEDPVHASFMGTWVVTRYSDVREALTHPALSSDLSNWPGFELRYHRKKLVGWMVSHSLLNTEDPVHRPLRSYLKHAFMPAAVSQLSLDIKKIVTRRLDEIARRGTFDFIAEFALAVPLETVATIFGIPEADRELVKGWSTNISNLIEPLPDYSRLQEANESIEAFTEYLRGMLASTRRSDLTESFLGKIVHLPVGTAIRKDDYVIPNLILMFAAAHETTVNLIGNGMKALLDHPEERSRLRADPSLMETAIEEFLRYDSPQQLAWRVATDNIVLGNQPIGKGEQLMLLLGAANRDPDYFDQPDRLDVGRSGKTRHLSFGQGRHNCIGSWLGRMQGKIALGKFLERFPEATAVPGGSEWLSNISFRGLGKMLLTTGPEAGTPSTNQVGQ